MGKTVDNGTIRLELGSNGELCSLRRCDSAMEYAAPHGLWRLVARIGTALEEEIRPENCREIKVSVFGDRFAIDFSRGVTANGIAVDLRVAVTGELAGDELRLAIAYEAGLESGDTVTECHFPIISLSDEAQKFDWHTAECAGTVHRGFGSWLRKLTGNPGYQGMDYVYRRKVLHYPGKLAAVNCFELAGPDGGLYFGSHDPSFQVTCHIAELEMPATVNLLMTKLPFAPAAKFDHFVLALHRGGWTAGAGRYRVWAAAQWYRPRLPPERIRNMAGWQRIIMKSQYGEVFYTFDRLPELLRDGLTAKIDTLLIFAWHQGGHDCGYPEYTPCRELGGAAGLRAGIEGVHALGGKVNLYFNGQLIDLAGDFWRNGPGPQCAIRDIRGNPVIQTWGFSGRGVYNAHFGGRGFARACPTAADFTAVLERGIDLAAELGADGVFFDQLGSGDPICFAPGHGHAVPLVTVMAKRRAMLEKLTSRAHAKGLTIGIEHLCDLTASAVDYVHSFPGGSGLTNGEAYRRGAAPDVATDLALARYIFPEFVMTNRDIRDDTDIERRVNRMLVHNLRADVEVFRCQRSLASAPRYAAYLAKIEEFCSRHLELRSALYRADALHRVSTAGFDAADHLLPDGRVLVLATQSYCDRLAGVFTLPGHRLTGSDGCGEALISESGDVILGRHGIALLEFTSGQMATPSVG